MIDKSHVQKFYDIQKYTPSKKDLKNLALSIQQYLPVVIAISQQENISNAEDLKYYVSYYASLLYDTYISTSSISSLLYEHQAIENLIKNPKLIQQEYPNVKDTPNTHTIYTANLTRSTKLALINALDEVKKLEEFAKENNITSNTSADIFYNNKSPNFKKYYNSFIGVLKSKTLHEKVLIMLNEELQQNEESTRSNLINSLSVFHNFFKVSGIANSYLSSYKFNGKKFDFADLEYELSTNSTSKDELGFIESFSPEFLETLSINDLCFLNTFWCNRFAKECTNFLNTACAINSLNLWENILNGETSFNITDNELTDILRKSTFISKLLNESFTIFQNSINKQEEKMGNKFSGSLEKDYSSYYEQLHNYIGQEYYDFFSTHLAGPHDLFEDVSQLVPFSNLQMLTYRNKVGVLEPMIKYLLDNPQRLKNWGIIRKELVDGTIIDSIAEKRPKVLMAFDIEGFNFPFRFHMPVDSLMDLTQMSNTNFLIPEYQGADDFIINGELVPSNIIMPIQKNHEETITEAVNNSNRNKNFWEHLYFLMDQSKFPKHLSKTIVTNKKKTVQTRLPICYTDLKTGERYFKVDKKLQKLEDDGKDGR